MPEEEEELFQDFYREDKSGASSSKAKKKKSDSDEIDVSFTINKRWLERGGFILIIVVLIMLYLFSSFEAPATAEVQEEEKEGFWSKLKSSLGIFSGLFKDSRDINLTADVPVTEEEEEPEEEEPKTTTTAKKTTTVTTEVKNFVVDIEFVRASADDKTITQVIYEVKNKLNEEIMPLIVKIYAYDPHSSSYRTTPRSERTISSGIGAGSKLNEPPANIFANFDNIDLLKTVKIEVLDGKNKLLDSAERNCRIIKSVCVFT